MGSDMYLAAQSFRPRPIRASWLAPDTLQVENDLFPTGYEVAYTGPATPEVRRLLRGLGVRIPRLKKETP